MSGGGARMREGRVAVVTTATIEAGMLAGMGLAMWGDQSARRLAVAGMFLVAAMALAPASRRLPALRCHLADLGLMTLWLILPMLSASRGGSAGGTMPGMSMPMPTGMPAAVLCCATLAWAALRLALLRARAARFGSWTAVHSTDVAGFIGMLGGLAWMLMS